MEANDRVGGRVLNHTLADGSVIESGGAFVGPTQNHILALSEELGVPTFKEFVAGKNVYASKGMKLKYTGTVPPDPLILVGRRRVQLKRIDEMSKQVPVDAPWTAKKAKRSGTRSPSTSGSGRTPSFPRCVTSCWPTSSPRSAPMARTCRCSSCSGTSPRPATRRTSAPSSAPPARPTAPKTHATSAARGSSRSAWPTRWRPGRAQRAGPSHLADGLGRRGRDRSWHRPGEAVIVAVPPPLALGIEWSPVLPSRRHQLLRNMPWAS